MDNENESKFKLIQNHSELLSSCDKCYFSELGSLRCYRPDELEDCTKENKEGDVIQYYYKEVD